MTLNTPKTLAPQTLTPKTPNLFSMATEMALVVPTIVAQRMTQMARAGAAPSAADHKEFNRMCDEKMAAFNASWNAMTAASVKTFWSPALWFDPTAALRVLTKGMTPIYQTAMANANRLGQTKPR